MRRLLFQAIALILFVSTGCSLSPSKWISELTSEPVGSIVFQMNEDGNSDLYILDVSTDAPVKLTNNTSEDISPAYIAAREKIGFVSDSNGTGLNIYEMSLDGQVSGALLKKNMILDYPFWSPDGNRIVVSMCEDYEMSDEQCLYDLFILDPASQSTKKISNTPEASEWVPAWSPDGSRIAFASDRDGDSEVYVIGVSGSGLVQLTRNEGYDGRPRWSPDGSQIAFETDREGDWDIFIMNADGSDPQPVTANAKPSDWQHSWSPDGKWLVYISDSSGASDLYIIRPDGTDPRRLTNNSGAEVSPVWIP
jgi:Tol biopolymer transport system component